MKHQRKKEQRASLQVIHIYKRREKEAIGFLFCWSLYPFMPRYAIMLKKKDMVVEVSDRDTGSSKGDRLG